MHPDNSGPTEHSIVKKSYAKHPISLHRKLASITKTREVLEHTTAQKLLPERTIDSTGSLFGATYPLRAKLDDQYGNLCATSFLLINITVYYTCAPLYIITNHQLQHNF